MAGFARTDLSICAIADAPSMIPGNRAGDTFNMAEYALHTPEAAASEHRDLEFFGAFLGYFLRDPARGRGIYGALCGIGRLLAGRQKQG
jgi:hypothetical protein